MNEKDLLHPLITESDKLASEFRVRKNQFDFISVNPKIVDDHIKEGWAFDRGLKNSVKLKKLKSHDERLENKFWSLLYEMGYTTLNQGRSFKIKYKRGGGAEEKQVDVFAKDDETVIVAECKSADRLTNKKSLQKDIEEFANLKKFFANSIKKHFGSDFKPKILWVFVTENIIWNKPDKDRASNQNIRIITDKELIYYRQITNHLGKAARYQFLAEYLSGQSIPELEGKVLPATRGKLGGKTFYSFVTTPKELLKISFVNHRSLNDPDGVPTYQRLVEKKRMKEIGEFINDGGYFPNNILINFKNQPRFDIVKKDELTNSHYGHLHLPDKYKSAWIIDGQHRLYGYANLDKKFQTQPILVIAFDQMKQKDEAKLFVTINHKQKSVPRGLLDDLDGDLKWGSDKPNEIINSTAARIIKNMNSELGNPIHDRVVGQGLKTTDIVCLTVPGVISCISSCGSNSIGLM
jgi:DGQHR domain-containing protein